MIVAFLLGVAGSWHCAAMCGGFAWGPRPVAYLAGRLLGYALVGALLGWSGLWALQFLGNRLLLAISGCLLLAMGLVQQRAVTARNGFSLTAFLWSELAPWLRSPGTRSRFGFGLVTAVFPCGLLYAAWLQAANQGTPELAALSMISFWAGTLPGLLLPRWAGRQLGAGARLDKLALLLTGSVMLAQALWPELPGQTGVHCGGL
ncbi:sulfite exporter TauE/SafE family protein [bacterium]|nr:sulfite exporter TauE/SafE family protein [bacterium]